MSGDNREALEEFYNRARKIMFEYEDKTKRPEKAKIRNEITQLIDDVNLFFRSDSDALSDWRAFFNQIKKENAKTENEATETAQARQTASFAITLVNKCFTNQGAKLPNAEIVYFVKPNTDRIHSRKLRERGTITHGDDSTYIRKHLQCDAGNHARTGGLGKETLWRKENAAAAATPPKSQTEQRLSPQEEEEGNWRARQGRSGKIPRERDDVGTGRG